MQIAAAMLHRLLGDAARVELRCAQRERAPRRARSCRPSRSASTAVVGLDDVAAAGDEQRRFAVGDDQQRFEAAQHAVGAPVLGELDGGALEVARGTARASPRTSRRASRRRRVRAGESGEHLAVEEAAHLARAALHHGLADAHLAVARHHHTAVVAHGEDRGAVKRLTALAGGPCRTPSSGGRGSRGCTSAWSRG